MAKNSDLFYVEAEAGKDQSRHPCVRTYSSVVQFRVVDSEFFLYPDPMTFNR